MKLSLGGLEQPPEFPPALTPGLASLLCGSRRQSPAPPGPWVLFLLDVEDGWMCSRRRAWCLPPEKPDLPPPSQGVGPCRALGVPGWSRGFPADPSLPRLHGPVLWPCGRDTQSLRAAPGPAVSLLLSNRHLRSETTGCKLLPGSGDSCPHGTLGVPSLCPPS